nr:hypothetical protein [Tanacetum cinerariifolium]
MSQKFICSSSGSPSPRLKIHLRTSSNLTRKSAELMWKSFEIYSRSVVDYQIKSLMNLLLMKKFSHSSRNLATKEILALLPRLTIETPMLKDKRTYHIPDLQRPSSNTSFQKTRAATFNKARKWKKPTSPLKKETLVITEEPAKKPAARRQPTDVKIRDTPGGSGNRASLEPEVPNEPKGNSIDTHKGTGLKPGVPDVSKPDSSDSAVDLNKTDDEEETQEDEFAHTPDDYVLTDDETHDLKYKEIVVEEKCDEEMTNADKVNVKLEDVNQEVSSAQV